MPLDSTSLVLQSDNLELERPALIVVIGSGPCHSGEMTSPLRSALAAADVVLLEEGVEPSALNLVAQAAFVERVETYGDPIIGRASGIARARKLASEGWRVVWLAAGNAEQLADELADAGLATGGCCAADAVVTVEREPRLLATPLNGLAG
jgi:hypothetical protein